MTKEVMLRISGVHFPDGQEEKEEMELITSGSYFEKDGRRYIKYDEVQEDSNEVIRNLMKIEENIKSGQVRLYEAMGTCWLLLLYIP